MLNTGLDGMLRSGQNGCKPSAESGGDHCSLPYGKFKRRLVSEDERRLRQSAYAKRATSLQTLMDAKRRKMLGDMVLASFM